jgi:preprotein translocase subunit SecD
MNRGWWYRFVFLLVIVSISILMIVPTVFQFDEEGGYPIKSKISLGLDLQGGLYMILGIDFNRVYQDEIKGYARKIEYYLKDNEIEMEMGEMDSSIADDARHSLTITNADQVEDARAKIKTYFGSTLRLTKMEGNTLEYALGVSLKQRIEEQSVSKSIEVIRNRIDEFGVTEPEIISQGKDRIIVQLPGVKDIERAKDLIGKTAKLEFRLVNDDVSGATINAWLGKAQKAGIEYKKGERFSGYIQRINEFLGEEIPKGYELVFKKVVNKVTMEIDQQVPFVVEENPRLTGDDLQDAYVQIDQRKNEPYVSLNFKTSGAKRFEEVTGDNIGKRLAVILDGNVYTAPNIQARIGGGRAQITMGAGSFNSLMKQSRDIALVLRAGALPVQLDFLEQRIVGPSLGADSIDKARVAGAIGCLLVFIFILFYYKISGAIAAITLSMNILLVLAALVGLEATLTLPGIAGIALTIGMAVDANIIIYERIREEVIKGVNNYKAVEGGFQHAFWTIIDANITTGLAGLCLLNFGTGPIRGFAITLLIGIVVTVYTSYFGGKLLFDFYMNKVEGQDLSV